MDPAPQTLGPTLPIMQLNRVSFTSYEMDEREGKDSHAIDLQALTSADNSRLFDYRVGCVKNTVQLNITLYTLNVYLITLNDRL